MVQPTSLIQNPPRARQSLDEIVEAFEVAWNRDGDAQLRHFLPGTDHPQSAAIVWELLCVDLERRWQGGDRRTVVDYQRQYPDLLADAQCRERLAYEEYRQRSSRGQEADPAEYSTRLRIDTQHWPIADSTHVAEFESPAHFTTDRGQADGPIRAPIGWTYQGFEIVEHLGSGRFGQVYLARQSDLADRHVVIKITTTRWCDSDRLARLQHTNVVPIHSVHRQDDVQVVCMPYFGRHTLEDVLRQLGDPREATTDDVLSLYMDANTGLDSIDSPGIDNPLRKQLRQLPYEQWALWILAQTADGLQHAHQRGILHRDLKPANILMSLSGHPLILDFNLSDDVIPGGQPSLYVGGTLPYMAREHLLAVDRRGHVDERSDIFALGVILFQMLTGRLPYEPPENASPSALESLVRQRSVSPPSVQEFQPRVSADTASIIARCLAPDPARRYQSVVELRDDLQRQLNNLPLRHAPNRSLPERMRKWVRRHPRLTSLSSVAIVAAGLLALSVWMIAARGDQIARLRAVQEYRDFTAVTPAIRMLLSVPDGDQTRRRDALKSAYAALAPYQLDWPDWQYRSSFQHLNQRDRDRLSTALQELLYLVASATLTSAEQAMGSSAESASLHRALHYNTVATQLRQPNRLPLQAQRSELLLALGRSDKVDIAVTQTAADVDVSEPYFRALHLVSSREYAKALPVLEELQQRQPQDFQISFLSGISHVGLQRFAEAEVNFTRCIALWPDAHPAYFHRGVTRWLQQNHVGAEADFTAVCQRYPDQPDVHFNRALARSGQNNALGAIEDYSAAIELGRDEALLYLLRSKAYKALGETQLAEQDLAEGLKRRPQSVDGWVLRGLAQWPTDPEAALEDFDEALRIEPGSVRALRNRAIILSERLQRSAEAISTLDAWIGIEPHNRQAAAMRGLLHARSGNRRAALADVQTVMATPADAGIYYQAACILAQTSQVDPADADRAVQLLREAISRDVHWANTVPRDKDLQPIADREDLRRLMKAAAELRSNPFSTNSAVTSNSGSDLD